MADDKIKLLVRLTPKAAQTKITGWATDSAGQKVLKIGVTAVPEKGKANKALIALLAKKLGIARSDIEIIKGETDRNKTLILNNISKDALNRLV